MGRAYLFGREVKEDPIQAYRWSTLASLQGNTTAMLSLGHLLTGDHGIPVDSDAAIFWYNLAGEGAIHVVGQRLQDFMNMAWE